jgi:uncharacterized protein involved in outer membrane biogenesis
MKKTLLVLGVIFFLVALTMAMVVLFMEFDLPELGNMALARAGDMTALELRAAGFRLSLARGLIWEDVEATLRFPGVRARIRIEKMVLEHRLLPLLTGKLVVRRVLLERPRLEISKTQPTRLDRSSLPPEREESTKVDVPPVAPKASRLEIALLVSEIGLRDGLILIRGVHQNEVAFFVDGLQAEMRNLSFYRGALTILHALTAVGELQARTVTLDSKRARNLKGALDLQRGRIELVDLKITTDSGAFSARIKMDFNRIPVGYEMNLAGSPIDLQSVAGLERGEGLGSCRIELDAEGFGTSAKNINGRGMIQLESGRLPPHSVLDEVEKALGSGTLHNSRYEETEAHFRVRDNQLILDDFHLETDHAALDLSGIVHLEGTIDLSLVVRPSHESSNVQEFFHITGTLGEPHIGRVSK